MSFLVVEHCIFSSFLLLPFHFFLFPVAPSSFLPPHFSIFSLSGSSTVTTPQTTSVSPAVKTTFKPITKVLVVSFCFNCTEKFRSKIGMEVVSFKVLRSYYRIWSEDDNFLVEDVEAQRALSVSKAQLSWFWKCYWSY